MQRGGTKKGREKKMRPDKNGKISGVCECGKRFWIRPRPFSVEGKFNVTYYYCKGCGKELHSEREDSICGDASPEVHIG